MQRIGKEHFVTAFGPSMTACSQAKPGDTVVFETCDCWHGQIKTEDQAIGSVDFTSLNPATGPLGIAGAEPGDALVVEILSIKTASSGLVSVIPGAGVIEDISTRSYTKILPISDGKVLFNGLEIASVPMIGVIGLATDGPVVPTGTPGRHGGNMDTKDICEGATLYLPVAQNGAFLAMGDVHACMADGEVCVTGCETAAEITVRVGVQKGLRLPWPVIRRNGQLMIIASASTLDGAVLEATKSVVSYLSAACRIPPQEAYMMASLTADMRISQCVDPLKTVRAVIPYEALGIDGKLRSY